MMYKGFEITVRVSAYTECTLTDSGEIDYALDTCTDFDDVVEYMAVEEDGEQIYWEDSIDALKELIDEYYTEESTK